MDLTKVALFFALVTSTLAFQNKYCQLSCDFGTQIYSHTVCARKDEKCGPAPSCGSDFKMVQFSDNHKQYILDLHNYLRNKVAMGNEGRGNQPSASNMKIMTYNKELEFIAQCWANTCNGNPLIHDVCRRTDKFEHVGQNLGFVNSSIPITALHSALKQLVMFWYDEVAIFHKHWVNDTQDRGEKVVVGHYTQMVWADTSEIGCAASTYTTPAEEKGKKWHHLVLVCDYGPGGNYLGAPLYDVGKPGSKCLDGLKPNEHYRGLCGDGKRVVLSTGAFDIFEL